MKEKYTFGKLGNNRMYLYISDNIVSIKSGGTALFGDKFLTKEEVLKKEDVKNIEITRPSFKSGTMTILTSSGKEVKLEIATLGQYNDAIKIKEYITK